MKRNRRRLGRRAWLMRAAVIGAAVAFSAGAPAVGAPAAAAGVEAAGEQTWEHVIGMGKLRLCWGICWSGWCCYPNPHF